MDDMDKAVQCVYLEKLKSTDSDICKGKIFIFSWFISSGIFRPGFLVNTENNFCDKSFIAASALLGTLPYSI